MAIAGTPRLSQPAPSAEASTVRLPSSATRRGTVTSIRLIRKVRPDPIWGGYAFDGDLFRPGQVIQLGDLRPSDDYPDPPLLIECAGSVGRMPRSKHSEYLHLLWRYEPVRNAWSEVARAVSPTNDWTSYLGPIALDQIGRKPVLVDPIGVADRVVEALEADLEPLSTPDRKRVMLAVYDRFQSKVVGW